MAKDRAADSVTGGDVDTESAPDSPRDVEDAPLPIAPKSRTAELAKPEPALDPPKRRRRKAAPGVTGTSNADSAEAEPESVPTPEPAAARNKFVQPEAPPTVVVTRIPKKVLVTTILAGLLAGGALGAVGMWKFGPKQPAAKPSVVTEYVAAGPSASGDAAPSVANDPSQPETDANAATATSTQWIAAYNSGDTTTLASVSCSEDNEQVNAGQKQWATAPKTGNSLTPASTVQIVAAGHAVLPITIATAGTDSTRNSVLDIAYQKDGRKVCLYASGKFVPPGP